LTNNSIISKPDIDKLTYIDYIFSKQFSENNYTFYIIGSQFDDNIITDNKIGSYHIKALNGTD
jgi:hypothetical protein